MTQDEVEAVARAIEDQLTAEDGWMVGTPALSSMCRDFALVAIAALDAARGDPVARVVEWLRELSGDEPLPPGCTKGEVWILRRAADAIERGEPFSG